MPFGWNENISFVDILLWTVVPLSSRWFDEVTLQSVLGSTVQPCLAASRAFPESLKAWVPEKLAVSGLLLHLKGRVKQHHLLQNTIHGASEDCS